MFSFTPRVLYPRGSRIWYPLDRRLDWFQSLSRFCGVERNLMPFFLGSNPGCSARNPSLYLIRWTETAVRRYQLESRGSSHSLQTNTGRVSTLTEDYRDFLQFLQVSDGIVPQIMPRPLYYTSFSTIYCSLVALSFDII